MPPKSTRRKRARGAVDQLPGGALRVRVYAGKDLVFCRRNDLIEIIPPGPNVGRAGRGGPPCHRFADKVEPDRFSVTTLLEWKTKAGSAARDELQIFGGLTTEKLRAVMTSAIEQRAGEVQETLNRFELRASSTLAYLSLS